MVAYGKINTRLSPVATSVGVAVGIEYVWSLGELFFFFRYCAGQRLAPHYRTRGDLEWEVESTTVTHSSADWWGLLLPLA